MGERKDGDPQVDRGHGGFSEREAKPLTTSDFSETVVELSVEHWSGDVTVGHAIRGEGACDSISLVRESVADTARLTLEA